MTALATDRPPRSAGRSGSGRPSTRSSIWLGAWIGIGVVLLVAAGHYFRAGQLGDRVGNPGVTGAPRPEGVPSADLMAPLQYATIFAFVLAVVWFTVRWRQTPKHPTLLMVIACTVLVWTDPIMNWAPYAVYNPQLWHFPEDWFWVSMSPTVEPWIVLGYAGFYVGPYFVAIKLLRKLQSGRPVDSFVWRHPLITMGALIFVIGFVFDMILEVTLVRMGMYSYSQVIPFGSLFVGTYHQFPLIWESTFITFVMIPAGVLLYRDDTGRTVAEKLAQRSRFGLRSPALASFLVMAAFVHVAYFCYGGAFALIRISGLATSVACPYPFSEAKVYDPQGYYEKEGQPGPYFEGKWAGWATGQPDGRPTDVVPEGDGSCVPDTGTTR